MKQAIAHICIISDRLIPNLIPILMERPQRVLLVASNSMISKGIARRMQNILRDKDVSVSVRGGLPSSNLQQITQFAINILAEDQEKYPHQKLVLNITGGNKLMTIAFMKAMSADVERIIYTDTQHNVLEQLPQRDAPEHAGQSPLQGVLDVPLYLAAQGMSLRKSLSDDSGWRQRANQRKALTKYLGKQAKNIGDFIGQLNYLCNKALDKQGRLLEEPVQHFNRKPGGKWLEAIQKITAFGVIEWDGDRTLKFLDVESTRYLGGVWLEEFAWHQARDLQPDDVRMSAEGIWEDTRRGRNELDVVIVHNNRLLLIECKTLRIGRDDQVDDHMLYKLDSVGDDVKGLFGGVILLTARKPTDAVNDRARHHKIQVVGADRFFSFQKDLLQWMETGQFPAG